MKTYPDEYIDSTDFIKYAAELCREINGDSSEKDGGKS